VNARHPLPQSLQNIPFRTRTARAAGVPWSRTTGLDLDRPFWGVRAPRASTSDIRGLTLAYAVRMRPFAVYSHVTAAMLWGIPLPWELESRHALDVAVPTGCTAPQARGIRAHRMDFCSADVVRTEVPLTTRARTWCDLAGMLDDEDLVAAGDFLLWRRHPVQTRSTVAQLDDARSRVVDRRAAARIARCLPLLSDRADSPPESIIRLRIVRAGLPTPDINAEIRATSGRFLAMPDLSWSKYRFSLDYEGDLHRSDRIQWEKDIARVPRLENNGWGHRRAGRADLADSTELIRDLRLRLAARGWSMSDNH
jgi:hypothetical protein